MEEWDLSNLMQFKSTKTWEGEDADEYVVDSWDDVLIDEEIIPPLPPINKSKVKAKKSNEDGNKQEKPSISTEDIRKLQIEADLNLAKEVFGVQQTILDTKEDFDKLKAQLMKLLTDANKNSNFSLFSEEIVQFLCTQLQSNELKRIHNWIGNLQIQRTKVERGEKKKSNSKAKARAKIRLDDENSYDFTSLDCDDFI